MGPIERALRKHPGPDATEDEFFEWAWALNFGPFEAISNVYIPGPKRRLGQRGYGVTGHSSKGRLRDAITEAIEAAEALGL